MKLKFILYLSLTLSFSSVFAVGPNTDKENTVKIVHAECKVFYNKTILNWSTEFEKIYCDFIIEATTDGKEWLIKGKVKSQGKSSKVVDYTWSDERDEKIKTYRIRQLDPSGWRLLAELTPENYSINVKMQKLILSYDAHLILDYSIDQDQEVLVRVYDSIGEQVLTTLLPSEKAGDYIYPLDVSELQQGNYLLQVVQVLFDTPVAEQSFKIE